MRAKRRGEGSVMVSITSSWESSTLWEYSKMAQTTTCMPAQSSACDTR